MADFTELWTGGPRFAQADHFKLGTDSVLLADFVNTSSAKRGIDLGCASGAIALLLLAKSDKLHMSGVDIVEAAVELARENMRENGLEGRSSVIHGDIKAHRSLFTAGSFDLVAVNPPYFAAGSGALSPKSGRDAARGEMQCSLEDIVRAAAFLLRTGGSFNMVHRPERLSEAFTLMSRYGLEAKRLRLVCHKADSTPSLVLIEGRRGAKPGLRIEPLLILSNGDGSESEEYKRIYHR